MCRSRTNSLPGKRRSSVSNYRRPASMWSAICSCRTIQTATDYPRHLREVIARSGLTLLGWRDVPTDNSTLGENRQRQLSRSTCRCSSAAAKESSPRGRVRAPAVHPAQVDLQRDLSPPGAPHVSYLPGVDLVPHGDLQGMFWPTNSAPIIRPARSGFRERSRTGPPALSTNTFPTWSLAHPYRCIAQR